MEKSRIPLKVWFECIYFIATAKTGITSIELGLHLGVRQQTAWFMMHRIAEGTKGEADLMLEGIVEADETTFSPDYDKNSRLRAKKKAYEKAQDEALGVSAFKKRRDPNYVSPGRGRPKGTTREVAARNKALKEKLAQRIPFEIKQIVFGAVERDGRLILKKLSKTMKDIKPEKIHPLIQAHISKSSVLVTDEHFTYRNTAKFVTERWVINHKKKKYVDGENGEIHTNTIENAWFHLKRTIKWLHIHVEYHHMDRYLNLHAFKWNRKKRGIQVVVDDLIDGLWGRRLRYDEMKQIKIRKCQGHIKKAA